MDWTNYFNSSVNVAFKNSIIDNNKFPEVLPPNPDNNFRQISRDENIDYLKDFRSKIVEMDEEIKQLKNIEMGKQTQYTEKMEYNLPNSKMTSNNEISNSTQYMIDEQNKRIQELQLQLQQLKSKEVPSRDIGISTNGNIIEQEVDLSKSLNDEITRRIGNWSARDPYQGPMDNLYFPFGSSGGGAPLRGSDGKVKTLIYGQNTLNSTSEEREKKILASQVLHESLKHEIIEQRLRRLQDKQQSREPQTNLSELISSFKGGRPKRDPETGILINNHLNSSDVTNIKLSTPRMSSRKENKEDLKGNDDYFPANYGLDLSRAAEERQMFKKLEKLKEQQQVRQHMDSWDQIWGRDIVPYHVSQKPYSMQSQRSNHRNFYQISDS